MLIAVSDLGHCSLCNLKENLWLCLTCGNLGCGRSQYGGIGGNNHGLQHATETSHPVAVKLGSLTAEGNADIYCYQCNDERVDPEVKAHLAHWGINIADRQKTEMSLTEMQIEHNLSYDFSMKTEDGRELTPVFGEGFTGLKNLGNSCYLASILQCLFAQSAFQSRYFHPNEVPPLADKPAEDLETQLRKVADGLLSGRYSYPDRDVSAPDDSSQPQHQKGLAPSMLKHLVGRGHEEFSTMRQQDAFELLIHLLELITRLSHSAPLGDPVESFRFAMEQRLQCLSCKKVRYRTDEQDNISVPVPARRKASQDGSDNQTEGAKEEYEPVTLKECLDIFTGEETVELNCPSCGGKHFSKRALFKTFPRTLAVNVRRFALVNWVPTKLDIPVIVGNDDGVDLSTYLSPGPHDSEEKLPDEAAAPAAVFQPNEGALAQLEAIGFPRPRCEKALHATGNAEAEVAMNWLFQHMEDPDIDAPVQLADPSAPSGAGSGGGAASISPESIDTLGAMGIAAPQARKALRETGGDVNRALDWVFSHPEDPGDIGEEPTPAADASASTAAAGSSEKAVAGSAALPAHFRLASIVCHKGASIHAGHYVAFVRREIPGDEAAGRQWVLFNDEKVVKGADADEMKKFAYVYFFEHL